MKRIAQTNCVLVGALTLILAGAGASYADSPVTPVQGNMGLGITCGSQVCFNGAINSGNVSRAQNVVIGGSASNSGSPTDVNGSFNSGNTYHGAQVNSSNNMQHIGPSRGPNDTGFTARGPAHLGGGLGDFPTWLL